MEVHVVADDPVRAAVAAAVEDADVDVRHGAARDVADARFAVVSDVAGAETFAVANEAARTGSTPWIAVEIGGAGGRAIADVDAAISGFAPGGPCFDCLAARVTSTTEPATESPRADRSAARFAGAVAGRESVRVLSGENRTIVGHVREVPYARRRLLPVPGCECGEPRDRSLDLDDDEALSLETAAARAELTIDERVGLLTQIGEVESFPAPYYLATAADTTAYGDERAAEQAAGVADDWNAALMKAVGESLERYCAGVYRDEDFVRAVAEDLSRVVRPTDLVRPDDAPAFAPDETHRWVEATNLATGERAHLPASAVHFPPPGERFVPAITTGLGLGSSTVDAVLSGLTEVVERDATMLAWYSTFEPLGLAVDDEGFDRLRRRAESEGLTVTPLLVTQDVDVPVVSVAVHREPDSWPAFAVGSAADLDATAAAVSALEEALQNWTELRGLGPEDAEEASGEIGRYASLPDEVRSFVDAGDRVDATAVGPETVPTGSAALEAVVDRVRDAGLTPYAARLTTRDVATVGFEAVRVVVPGAQPLFTREPYFGERAGTVPPSLGFEARLDRSFHPYP